LSPEEIEARRAAAASATKVAVAAMRDVVAESAPDLVNGEDCMRMYGELKTLDSQAVKIYNVKRRASSQYGANEIRDAGKFLMANATLRAMIMELRTKCPDEAVLQNIRDMISRDANELLK
jgi:hypothetical protein